MKDQILGDDMQAVKLVMNKGEIVKAEAGMLMYMDTNTDMQTTTDGGILKGIKRAFSGESFFITVFTAKTNDAEVCFSGPYPGKILKIKTDNKTILAQRDAYLCSTGDVDVSIAFTKRLGAGFFGGEGFILQKISGNGTSYLHAGGHIMERELKSGETLKLDTGSLVALEDTVDYNIEFVGGIKTALFGGEGLFFATLTGPGKVWMQTLPISRLAEKVMEGFSKSRGERRRGGQGIVGDLLSGN